MKMKAIIEMERMIKIVKSICNKDEIGITYTELLILSAINNGDDNLRNISRLLLMDKSPIHRKLSNLLEKGLISKEGKLHYLKFKLDDRGREILEEVNEVLEFIRKEDLKGFDKLRERMIPGEFICECNKRLTPIYCSK